MDFSGRSGRRRGRGTGSPAAPSPITAMSDFLPGTTPGRTYPAGYKPSGGNPSAGQDLEHSRTETFTAGATSLARSNSELPASGTGSPEIHEVGRDAVAQVSPQRGQSLWKLR